MCATSGSLTIFEYAVSMTLVGLAVVSYVTAAVGDGEVEPIDAVVVSVEFGMDSCTPVKFEAYGYCCTVAVSVAGELEVDVCVKVGCAVDVPMTIAEQLMVRLV